MNSNRSTTTYSLHNWLQYLNRPREPKVDLSLDRIEAVGGRTPWLRRPAPIVFTVGGTNGKGTTCCTLEQLAIQAGYRVGTFSSPHLLQYNERIRLQGIPVSDQALCLAFTAIEEQREGIELSYFEQTTLAALWLFHRAELEIVVLEVGLGGRMDAVNWVEPTATILTNVGWDHTRLLGKTLEAIGAEKAGIFRAHTPAILGDEHPPQSVLAVLKREEIQAWIYQRDWYYHATPQEWILHAPHLLDRPLSLPYPQIPLHNAAMALTAWQASQLPLDTGAVQAALTTARLPGRLQCIQQAPLVLLDVAHNPHGTSWLARRLRELQKHLDPAPQRFHGVVGMLGDKDVEQSVQPLFELIDSWSIAPVAHPRGAGGLERLQSALRTKQTTKYPSVSEAFHSSVQHLGSEEGLICFGSFYTIAEILGNHPQPEHHYALANHQAPLVACPTLP